jgi:hypothetical protein
MATLFNTKIKDTYQSLLKLEDNTILTTTSKNITDGLGNASPLYMSTTRIGIGTNSPTSALTINGSITFSSYNNTIASGSFPLNAIYTASVVLCSSISDSGGVGISFTNSGGSAYARFGFPGNLNNTIGQSTYGVVPDLGARLGVRGAGSTSATTSLLVQNSSAATLLQVLDNGLVYVGTGFTGLSFSGSNTQIFNNGGGAGNISFAMGGVSYLNIYQPINNGGGFTSGTLNTITTPFTYTNTSGAVSYNLLSISPGINNTGTYVGTIRGIYYNPSLTSLVGTTHIAIQTVTGDVLFGTTSGNVGIGSINSGWRLNVDGAIRAQRIDLTGSAGPGHVMLRIDDNGTVMRNNTFNINSGNGNAGQSANLAVGNTDTTVARLYVKGSGSTSATTSLLVQNSGGNTSLQIQDNGAVSVINEGNFSVNRYGNTLLSTGQSTSSLSTYNSSVTVTNTYVAFNTLGNYGWAFLQDLFQGYHPMIIQDATYKARETSALVELNSKTRGFLPPKMTTAQKLAIVTPTAGLMVYDTDLARPCFFNGATWITL